MALTDLFSKRQRRAQATTPDVYRYDVLPTQLRVQIVQILRDALGEDSTFMESQSDEAYTVLHDSLAREFGVFQLGKRQTAQQKVFQFILDHGNVEQVLDAVELGFHSVEELGSDPGYVARARPKQTPAKAIDELNARFKEHAVGYQFESGCIVRTDSSFLHAELINPAFSLLSDPRYAGAEKEFQNAHEHYRHGRNEESIAESLKAMESTLKTICSIRRWRYQDSDTVKVLLDIVFECGLVSAALQSEFSALRSILESGLPTIRNKQSGHGSGTAPRTVPIEVAAYALHLAAANILFLARAENTLP